MRRADQVAITLSSPSELLSVMPHLLEHHNIEGIAIVVVSGGTVVLCARADAGMPPGEVARRVRSATTNLTELPDLHVIGYTTSSETTAIHAAAEALDGTCGQVRSLLHVVDGRFYCLFDDCECTPAEGTPIDTSTPAATAFVAAGSAPFASRDDIRTAVAPVTGGQAKAMQEAFARAAWRSPTGTSTAAARTALADAFTKAQQEIRLDDDEAAELCTALHDLIIRDEAWKQTDNEIWQYDLWADLTRRCLQEAAAPVATLLGWAAYRRGNGAVAMTALRRALDADADYTLAALLYTAVEHGMPPSSFDPWPRS